jgi:hypothetical protein
MPCFIRDGGAELGEVGKYLADQGPMMGGKLPYEAGHRTEAFWPKFVSGGINF